MNLAALDVRNYLLAHRAKKAGANSSLRIILEARAAGVPISWAFALVDQESAFENVIGHDKGSILAGMKVTHLRVLQLLNHVTHGGISNGVGFTQLTSPDFIREAERMGGAHIVKYQLRVGFRYFGTVTKQRGPAKDAYRYNGAFSYQAQIASKQRKWHKILVKGD